LRPEYSGELLMYRYTFSSRVTLVAALLLCVSLLLQPVASVYAEEPNESDSVVDASEPVVTLPTEPITPVEPVDAESEPASSVAVVEPSSESDESDESDEVVSNELLQSATTTNTVLETELEPKLELEPTATSSPVVPGNGEGPTSTTSTTSSPATTIDSGDESDEVDKTSDEAELALTGAATSSAHLDPGLVAVSTVQSDQSIAFNKNECTEVADGSFYCQKLSLENQPADALFAAPDKTGDLEIYVVQDGVERKLTDNQWEDASPYYDSRSKTIVWHRLINDRYQIISYDIETGTETQLTDTRVNNMEPARNGEYVVWQRWVTNNWEIVLFDGEQELQLTDSLRHDIAPHILGDMIIWNVRSSDGTQSLMTYEISSQTYNHITDTEGVSVTNPRMLVMYEAQYQNGDTIMKGFDLATGEIIPIEHLPRQLPPVIPDPDATGEIRALPNNPNQEDDQETTATEPEVSGPPPTGVGTTISATSTATTIDALSLDLRSTGGAAATTTDLVVEQAAIPDVVIPPFSATSSAATGTSTQDR
jgi:hypothetical protein